MANLQELTTPPSIADYTPLSEHQAATPSHFFGAKPVLHLYCPASRLLISQAELDSRPLFAALHQTPATNGSAGAANGTQEEQVSVENVDIWVTSENLILFSPAKSIGIEIPYPRLSLHALLTLPATSTQGLYMQLVLSENPANTADEDLEMLECTLIPSSTASLSTAPASNTTDEIESQTDAGGEATQTPGQALYAAVTACADLHPDPAEDDEEEVGLPGAGGWITSENLHEFMDEEGNLSINRDDEGLGAGAGAVRERDDDGEGDDQTKWQRTG